MRHLVSTLRILLVSLLLVTAAVAESLSGGGTWQSNSGTSIKGTWTAKLDRTGDTVSGDFAVEGSPLFNGGSATGSVSGENVVLGIITAESTQATFTGRLEAGSVAGTWELPEIDDTGTWEGTLE